MKKPGISGEKLKSGLRRAAWLSMAILFLVTGLGIGLVYFWQATHPQDQSQTESQNLLQGKPLAGFTPVAKIDSLQKIDNKIGDGNEVKTTSTVTVLYTGALASTGVVFESSVDSGQPATFQLNQVIKGWSEGLVGMKVGGERRLLIPANMAYGASSPPGSGIPPNADLVFDVTLLAVE